MRNCWRRFIRRHIPGEPSVIVKHMPGAGSLALMNYLWSVAHAGRTVLRHSGIERGVRATDRLAAGEGRGEVQRATSSAGSAASSNSRRSASPGTRPASRRSQDVKQRPLRFGSSGASSGGEMFAQMLNEFVGTKLQSIRGYRGSNDITLAMERGEIDGFVGWCWSCMKADKPQYLNDKLVNVFVQFGRVPEADAMGIPSALDLATHAAGPPGDAAHPRQSRDVAAVRRAAGVPPERMKALRDAFDATTKDPAFLAAAQKSGREISVYTAAQIDALLKESYALPEAVIQRATEVSAPR